MKAARLYEGETTLRVEEVDAPDVRDGTVLVDVQTVFLPPFTASLVEGFEGLVTPPKPFTPGMDAVGSVRAVGTDVGGLEVGQRVYCDSFYRSPVRGAKDDTGFIGNFGVGEGSAEMLSRWPDGALAEQMLLPAECLVPIPTDVSASEGVLCRLGWLGTAYGALTKVGLAAGEAVAIVGGTGLVGAGAVLVALAMGAGQVFAIGRREDALEEVGAIDARVGAGAALPDDQSFDVVLSAIEASDASPITATLPKLRRSGRLVMVGVTEAPVPIPTDLMVVLDLTVCGSLWFERRQAAELLGMIAAGTLDLSPLSVEEYALDDVGEALEATRRPRGAFRHVAVRCGG